MNAVRATRFAVWVLYRGRWFWLTPDRWARVRMLLALTHNNQRKKGEK